MASGPAPLAPRPDAVGLTAAEAARRLAGEGPNRLPAEAPRGWARLGWETVTEPMFGLLLGAVAVYALLGDRLEAAVMVGWVAVMVGIDVAQARRTETALAALRELSSPRARVVRDGAAVRIAGADVVRGDLVLLAEGDRVPADTELVDGTNLLVDESLLTGESVPVRKRPGASAADPTPGGDDLPWLWSGTLVVGGSGAARVHATGARTELGRIGATLAKVETARTPLQAEVDRMVRRTAGLAIGACLFLVAGLAWTRGDLLDALLAGIALAMSAIPEEFPLVLTVMFAIGAWRMARRKVLTRRVAAVEALGAITVLCTDKTGTLTENRMRVRRLWTPGCDHEVGDAPLPEAVHPVVETAILASPLDPFDPMDQALRTLGELHLAGTEHLHGDAAPLRDYPLSPELLAVAHAWTADGDTIVAAKGAVEAVVDLCHLDEAAAEPILHQARRMSAEGLRVLATATAVPPDELPDHPHAFPFLFVGLVGFADPVRASVPAAIATCRAAGVRVVVITGDAPETARAIARDAGLGDHPNVLTGRQLDGLDDDALAARLEHTRVVARAVPATKLRIVRALQAHGEVVGMTGDGVNDAPALRAADVGVAMGGRGTDVAREAAALVVTDDDFASIVAGVEEGRRIYANLVHAVGYILAVHVPAVGLSLLPVLFGWPLLLLPLHVAFLEMVIDPACAVAFEAEPPPPDLLRRPPRRRDTPMFDTRMVLASSVHGLAVLGAAMLAYTHGAPVGEDYARGLAFVVMVAGNVGLIHVHRGASPLKNPLALGLSLAALTLLAVVLYVPPVAALFRIVSPPPLAALGAMFGGFAAAVVGGLGVPAVRQARA